MRASLAVWLVARLLGSCAAQKLDVDVLETKFYGLRLWMIIGIIASALLIVIVILCCVFDCRIPRTHQEILADRENTKRKKQLKQKQYANPSIPQSLQTVAGQSHTAMLPGLQHVQNNHPSLPNQRHTLLNPHPSLQNNLPNFQNNHTGHQNNHPSLHNPHPGIVR